MHFRRGILATSLLSAAIVMPTPAQANEAVNLDEIVVVSAYRTETNLSDVADNMTVLDQTDIEALPATNVGELLSYAPGLDVATHQGFGAPASYNLQNSTANENQVKVMVDGVPLNNQIIDPQLQRLSVEGISQVEVIGGASSAMWGSGLGGIVNIISKDASSEKISARFKTLVGENRKKQEVLELSGTLDSLEYYTLAEYIEAGVENRQTDSNAVKSLSKLKYIFSDDNSISLLLGSDSGATKNPYTAGYWQKFKYRQKYGKVGYEHGFDSSRYSVEAKFSRFNHSSEFYYDMSYDLLADTSIWKANHYQVSAKAEYDFRESDLLMLALDMDWEMLKSEKYSDVLTAQYQAPMISYLLREGNLDLHLGVRFDISSQYKDQVNPSAGFVYKFEDPFETKLRFRVAKAYNYPKLIRRRASLESNWMFTYEDNYSLKPERALVTELGFNFSPLDKLEFDISGYLSKVKDGLSRSGSGSALDPYKWINYERFKREGLTLRLKYDLNNEFSFKASASAHRVHDYSTPMHQVVDGSLRRTCDLGIYYRGGNGFNASLIANYKQWRLNYNWYESRTNKFLLDLKTEKKFEHFSIFFNVTNLMDSEYWVDMERPYPGRHFEGGIELNF